MIYDFEPQQTLSASGAERVAHAVRRVRWGSLVTLGISEFKKTVLASVAKHTHLTLALSPLKGGEGFLSQYRVPL